MTETVTPGPAVAGPTKTRRKLCEVLAQLQLDVMLSRGLVGWASLDEEGHDRALSWEVARREGAVAMAAVVWELPDLVIETVMEECGLEVEHRRLIQPDVPPKLGDAIYRRLQHAWANP